ncbi:3-phosphoshikimate 1-carboxyvinyltransferase [Marinitenerispora sediminis]|uniref:3-phosphoshikimate 1-carboxyvinyltransferase n=1 Tax=Marinitenerispora sediminis TaxID=1931232 RepID=A0A368T681_9ACTN|nr:3-phosphoshikimate 1-carboxyvinyltransferase [Marinitenerispora sediminis]RCV51874.1 3-phosphoshikimate 1-carboxyvinyltransferase [Marinitenerispora sediminis]RCV54829.1 3-phosphoshikimate 1-carboxyvinyltransferase [Marinitenerispora sediminis]RCV58973.1 3-phosphoshikimate 1-carboxyvinyltransferase [Marinitenerispora sediminis]
MGRLRVTGAGALRGTVRVPGDKSISHRALILASLADGRSTITGLSTGEDVTHTRRALTRFGVTFEEQIPGQWQVTGGLRHEPDDVLDCGNAGTGIRLLAGVCAGVDGISVLTGDQFLRRRPMDRVAVPLREMGAGVDGREAGRFAPLVIRGGGLRGIAHDSPVASAQVKSSLLLAGLSAAGPTTVVEPHPTRRHTEEMLEAFGGKVAVDGASVTVHPGTLTATDVTVPGDPSQAAFWVVAGVLATDGEIEVPGLYLGYGRADFVGVLQRMGAEVDVDEATGTVRARASRLRSVEIVASDIPGAVDEIPVLAVAAAAAEGTTVISGAAELRVKESDRIASTVKMLRAFGVEAEERPDGMVVHGRADFTAGRVDSHGDHRIAMAAAVAAVTRAQGDTVIDGWESVATSYPGFARDLESVAGAGVCAPADD